MAKANPKFAGLTEDQVLQLCGQIASTANLMADICRDKAEEHGSQPVSTTFHALATMLCGIGALADMPSGGNCVGTFADWMVGPLFNPAQSNGGAS